MSDPQQLNQSKWAVWLIVAVVLAVLCNGAGFYLKRTGLIDKQAYAKYWANHCFDEDGYPASMVERPCLAYTTPEEILRAKATYDGSLDQHDQYVYEVAGAERLLKLAKDLVVLATIAISAWLVAKGREGLPPVRRALPIYLLAGACAAAFAVSVAFNGTLVALAGLRSVMFVPVALLASWLAPRLSLVAAGMGVLLILEAVLLPLELVRGIHLFHEWSSFSLASRAAGTLAQPNSLGIFAVTAIAFYYCFSTSRSWLLPLQAVALALIFLSGSGTGLVCVTLVLVAVLIRQAGPADRMRSVAMSMALVAVAALALPVLSGRGDLYDSVWGGGDRWVALQSSLVDRQLGEVVFGSGLGATTNTAINLSPLQRPSSVEDSKAKKAVSTDSALTSMLNQAGLVGAVLFYATLLWAGRRDRTARPFYCLVAVCSLTINITELFPVNMLIGLALSRSAWVSVPESSGK